MTEILLYQMKHRFRSRIELLRKDSVVSNVQTGRKTVNQTIHCLDSVVEVTNNWLTRTFNRTDVDINTKGWLVDPRDLPDDYEPSLADTVQDYGRVNNVDDPKLKGVYEITFVDISDAGYLIIGRKLAGSDQRSIQSALSVDQFNIGGTAS